MADGLHAIEQVEVKTKPLGIFYRTIQHRQFPFALAAGLVLLLLISLSQAHHLVDDFAPVSILNSPILLSSTLCFWVPIILLFRDANDDLGGPPSLALPVISLVLLTTGTAIIVYGAIAGKPFGIFDDALAYEKATMIVSFMLLVFVPLCWNAVMFILVQKRAKFTEVAVSHGKAGLAQVQGEDDEAASALVATLVFGSIGLLALFAGEKGEQLQVQGYIGIGLCLVVVAVFAAVVFLEPIAQMAPVRFLAKVLKRGLGPARWLASFYNAIDYFLVQIVAVVAGTKHHDSRSRYTILGVTLTCLCFLSWFLPAPLGMLPAVIGILLAFSVSRLWSWVEDDRALAVLTKFSPTTPYRTDMREDYRDETLLGFIFIFALMPIMMAQAHNSGIFGAQMFSVPESGGDFRGWLGFFGIELAKAVPIVDWAEIYQVQNASSEAMIEMNSKASRHSVFLARATVDLVLIAALLQALAVSNRNRQQKQLFKAGVATGDRFSPGLIDRFDSFVEKSELERAAVSTLTDKNADFDRELSPSEAHELFDLRSLSDSSLVDFRRYNSDRLSELHGSKIDGVRRGFIAAIAHERPDFSLKTRLELLDEAAERNRSEDMLYRILDMLEKDIEIGYFSDPITIADIRSILYSVRKRSGLQRFKERLLDMLCELQPKEDVLDNLADVAGLSDPDRLQYTRKYAVRKIGELGVSQGPALLASRAKRLLLEMRKTELGTGVAVEVSFQLKVIGRVVDSNA